MVVPFGNSLYQEWNLLIIPFRIIPFQGSFISKEVEKKYKADKGKVDDEKDELRSVKWLCLKPRSERKGELGLVE